MEYPSPSPHSYNDSALGTEAFHRNDSALEPEVFPDAMVPMWLGKKPSPRGKILSLANAYKAAVILAATLAVGNCANTALCAYQNQHDDGGEVVASGRQSPDQHK